jgi:hypothetical protein
MKRITHLDPRQRSKRLLPSFLLIGWACLPRLAEAAAASCLGPTFSSFTNFGMATQAVAVVVAYFNGDGKLDFAVADQGSYSAQWSTNSSGSQFAANEGYTNSSVSVFLANGDGTFRLSGNYSVGINASDLVAADFNKDGKPDLAVASKGGWDPNQTAPKPSGTLVLLNNGDGTFEPPVAYDAGATVQSVVVGDFNGDDKIDLALGTTSAITVLFGHGDGTFEVSAGTSLGNDVPSGSIMTAADFNHDGKTDLIGTDAAGKLATLLSNGDGTFQSAFHFGSPVYVSSIVVEDINGDANPDVIQIQGNTIFCQAKIWLGEGCQAPAPALSFLRHGTSGTLSWPTPSAGFTLEKSVSLNPSFWKPATVLPTINNGHWAVTVPLVDPQGYYRLHEH